MRKSSLLLCLICCAFSAYAETGPKITFKRLVHDFGDLDRGGKVETSFEFENSGDATLQIDEVTTSCGCTSAALKKKTYAPKEKGTIPVTFNSQNFEGKITKRITVSTNDKSSPKTILTIQGTILTDVQVTPSALVFTDAKPSQINTLPLKITTARLPKLELTNLKIEPEYLTMTEERVDDKTVILNVSADGTMFPKGKTRLNGYITLDTNSKTQGTVRTAVTIEVTQPVRMSPRALYFYASKAGKSRQLHLKLESNTGRDFKITQISSDIAFITAAIEQDGGKQKSLLVTLADNAPQGKFQGFLTLKTNIIDQNELVIDVRGSVIP
jgi:Protein of unknown function (DUF1573)